MVVGATEFVRWTIRTGISSPLVDIFLVSQVCARHHRVKCGFFWAKQRSSMSACPNRDYYYPTPSNPGTDDSGGMWFPTEGIDKTCDDVDGCIIGSSNEAQTYCNNNAGNFCGGSFNAFCVYPGQNCGDGSTKTYWGCLRQSWDTNNFLPCCLGTVNDSCNCDPTWCPQNLDVCTPVLSTYCAQETNVASDAVCVEFCSQPQNKIYCDAAMEAYCTENQSSGLSICACLNSIIPRPSCFDATCTNDGSAYLTAQMVSDETNCGNPVLCQQFINCANAGQCNITDPLFVQNCGNQPGPSPGPTPSPTRRIPDWVWLVIGLIGLLIVILIGGYLVYRHRRAVVV